MIIIGLTGSIGMGKTTIAKMFAEEAIPVWDADEAVHRLYQHDEVLKDQLVQAFGGNVLGDEGIDREKLSKILAQNPSKFDRLNTLVHPAVARDRLRFLQTQSAKRAELVLCEIPLLFESGAQDQVDKVIVVSASESLQRQRVLMRPGMNEEKLNLILSKQMPDVEKRAKADFVIDTGQDMRICRLRVREIIAELLQKPFTNQS